jgi:hypothetical protein
MVDHRGDRASNEEFREPPTVTDPVVALSHVQRANHHATAASDVGSLRIFRQGYGFLEPHGVAPGFRAGLNFASFQDTPDRVMRILRQSIWLDGTNRPWTRRTGPRVGHLRLTRATRTAITRATAGAACMPWPDRVEVPTVPTCAESTNSNAYYPTDVLSHDSAS